MRLAAYMIGALLLAASVAWAHDDASWIMEKHRWCCGPKDCIPVPNSYVLLTKKGWRIKGIRGAIPKPELKQSVDAQWWACRYLHNNKIRCLFRPPSFM